MLPARASMRSSSTVLPVPMLVLLVLVVLTRVLPARNSMRSGRFWRKAGRRALERPSVVALGNELRVRREFGGLGKLRHPVIGELGLGFEH